MIKKNDKVKTVEEINNGKLENIFNIIPNLSDKVLDYSQRTFDIVSLIRNTFEDKRIYESKASIELLILSGVQARMKQQFSISELPLSLTSKEIIEKIKYNIAYDTKDGLLKESNIRAILEKYKHKEEETLEFNNVFIKYYNTFIKELLNISKKECNIHILDCSILDVNIDNENYEGSTVTSKGGEHLRGYKIGALRGVLPNSGIIEEITMETAKTSDFKMTEEMILNSSYLKKGDYLLEDRGFLDISLLIKLNKKGIFVIIPSKKNMQIYLQAVNEAKIKDKWTKHPNKNRHGQDICLITGLEDSWLTDKDKLKKPENLKLDYQLNVCVIRFEKEKNQKVLSDEELITSDEKYAYACIITNDTSLSASEIIRLYEQRPEIEEDFRQLKDFWGLNTYKSTQYHIISFVIMVSLIGYALYQLYKESEEGHLYIGKSLIVEEKHGLYIVKGVRTAIVTEKYFGIFEQDELLDLYVSLSKEKREVIKQYLTL